MNVTKKKAKEFLKFGAIKIKKMKFHRSKTAKSSIEKKNHCLKSLPMIKTKKRM